jgi:hypothetical protein
MLLRMFLSAWKSQVQRNRSSLHQETHFLLGCAEKYSLDGDTFTYEARFCQQHTIFAAHILAEVTSDRKEQTNLS